MDDTKYPPMPAPRITPEQINLLHAKVTYVTVQPEGSTSTFCHAYLPGQNGAQFFLATGHSACVSPENFDAQRGRDIAYSKAQAAAKDKLWEMEGYALFKQLNPTPTSHEDRVRIEHARVSEDIRKLAAFLTTPIYAGLDPAEQERMHRQLGAMQEYAYFLGERVSAFKNGGAT